MALDLRYIPSKYFQEGILDKDTGCPLAGGIVKFYKDQARTEGKPIYRISGSPPNYTYTSLGDEVTLSGIGTFEYDGSDIIPYFFPYDESGNVELYYYTVESAGSVFQFSREGEPNVADRDIDAEKIVNYVPNGQFLLHHDIVADPVVGRVTGQITQDVTDIAEGGWSFERSAGSSAVDIVLFNRIGSYDPILSKSPRYTVNVKNATPHGADIYKDLRIKFRDVNKFASDTNFYTLSFQGKSNSGSTSDITVKLIKNFGTGGDPQEEADLQNIILTTDYLTYDIPFIFGTSAAVIGDADDDFIQLVISFPTSYLFDDEFDNFILTDGDVQIQGFPDTTNAEFIRDSMAGWAPPPEYQNQNIYLPVITGLKGFEYDTTVIGNFVVKSSEVLERGQLWADGTQVRVDAYSADNIPYRRLYEKWSVLSNTGLSIYGTGENEMQMHNVGAIPTINYQLRSNTGGAVTPAADSVTAPTGFTFTPVQPDPYIVQITFLSGAVVPVSSYWIYHTTLPYKFIVWYEVDGVGTKPTETADRYLKVVILSTDVAATVANKTARAINGYVIQVPDFRGYFLRVTDGGVGRDPDAATRTNRGDTFGGDLVGTIQSDENKAHGHLVNANNLTTGADASTPQNRIPGQISGLPNAYSLFPGVVPVTMNAAMIANSGGAETRPINRYVNLAVLY